MPFTTLYGGSGADAPNFRTTAGYEEMMNMAVQAAGKAPEYREAYISASLSLTYLRRSVV